MKKMFVDQKKRKRARERARGKEITGKYNMHFVKQILFIYLVDG